MSTVSFDKLDDCSRQQLICSLAALVLHDDKTDITSEKLSNVIKASGNTVAAYWPSLFSKALDGKDVASLLTVGGGSSSNAGPAQTGGDKVEEKKEEKVEEEEEDIDMGGMFD